MISGKKPTQIKVDFNTFKRVQSFPSLRLVFIALYLLDLPNNDYRNSTVYPSTSTHDNGKQVD